MRSGAASPCEEGQGAPTIHALDALRGIAAIAVVTFHYKPLLGDWHFPSAYLAVDLFFIISGIVIATNYESRLMAGLGTMAFLRRRLLRLMPLYLVALALATAVAALGIMSGKGNWTWAMLAPVVLTGALMLPNPFPAPRADLFPLNPPCWSLFWELVINLIYAVTLPWLGIRALLAGVAISAVLLAVMARQAGGVDFGYEWAWMAIPAMRVILGFSIGVLIARLSAQRGPALPNLSTGLLVGVVLAALAAPLSLGWIKDMFVLLVLFPLLCSAAMTASVTRQAWCHALGMISYPLYVLHAVVPFEKLATMALHQQVAAMAPWIGIGCLGAIIAVAWALAVLFDRPVRIWLSRR